MNILMIRTSQERQQKFLKRLFKQDQEAHRHEREKDREFLLKIGQIFLNNNERHVLLQIRKHFVLYTLCNLHLYRLILLFLWFLWQDYLLKFNILISLRRHLDYLKWVKVVRIFQIHQTLNSLKKPDLFQKVLNLKRKSYRRYWFARTLLKNWKTYRKEESSCGRE